MTVRGVRNNNPGNIRVGSKWQGLMDEWEMTPEQKAEKAFCVFQTPKWGFRAMAKIFLTYREKHGAKTIRQAITRWAPPNENNTEAYVAAVAKACHWKADDPAPFSTPGFLIEFCEAVAVHENGGWFFKMSDLTAGVNAAIRG